MLSIKFKKHRHSCEVSVLFPIQIATSPTPNHGQRRIQTPNPLPPHLQSPPTHSTRIRRKRKQRLGRQRHQSFRQRWRSRSIYLLVSIISYHRTTISTNLTLPFRRPNLPPNLQRHPQPRRPRHQTLLHPPPLPTPTNTNDTTGFFVETSLAPAYAWLAFGARRWNSRARDACCYR